MRLWIWLFFFAQVLSKESVDYWSDSFDIASNCKRKDEITPLMGEGQCAETVGTDSTYAFQKCKMDLSILLLSKCSLVQVEKAGEFIYCQQRGQTKCCFSNHTCQASWNSISGDMAFKAKEYLKNKTEVFEELVADGFKSCYPIENDDASQCAEDCNKFEQEQFAKNCTDEKGIFKCCIRRDKRFCHECRFCCTLPFCTTSDGRVLTQNTGHVNRTTKLTAIEKLYPLNKMYKEEDYRCYDPKSDPDPKKWKFYKDQKKFREAKTEEEMGELEMEEYDKRIFNFEDPEVMLMATGDKFKHFWKEVYGFDYVSHFKMYQSTENDRASNEPNDTYTYKESLAYCMRSEYGPFARKCQKKKGFFKCCNNALQIKSFSETRDLLFKSGLLKKEPEYLCGKNFDSENCLIQTAVQMCTVMDPLTGKGNTEFKTELKKKFELGGNTVEGKQRGLRSIGCIVPNTCVKASRRILGFVPGNVFEKVYDQNGLCGMYSDIYKSIPQQVLNTNSPEAKQFIERWTFVESSIHSTCNKTSSPVLLCNSEEAIKKLGDVQPDKYLRELDKRLKEKHGKKKSGKKHRKSEKHKKRHGKKECHDKRKSVEDSSEDSEENVEKEESDDSKESHSQQKKSKEKDVKESERSDNDYNDDQYDDKNDKTSKIKGKNVENKKNKEKHEKGKKGKKGKKRKEIRLGRANRRRIKRFIGTIL